MKPRGLSRRQGETRTNLGAMEVRPTSTGKISPPGRSFTRTHLSYLLCGIDGYINTGQKSMPSALWDDWHIVGTQSMY